MHFSLKYLLCLVGIVFTSSSCSQNNNEDVTVEYELNKGYFLQSTNSNWKSKYYDYIDVNESPSIAVAEKHLFGAIDKNENIIIPFEYEFVESFNSVILAHPFPKKHDLYARITAFDHSGKKLFSQELMSCTPISDHLIACAKNQVKGVIFNLEGEELYGYMVQEKVREILPNIIEFKSTKGELQYIDGQGKKVATPKYLPLYKTYKNYEESDYMVAIDKDGNRFLLDKNNEVTSLPEGYLPERVKYDFVMLNSEEEKRKMIIYDIKNKKILTNTASSSGTEIRKCNQEGMPSMIYFNNFYPLEASKGVYQYVVNESNEIIKINKRYDAIDISEDEKFIQNFCDPSAEKYFFKRRIANSNNFTCYEGLNGESYFKNRKTEKVFVKENLFLVTAANTSYDKYSIVYSKSENNAKKYGLIDGDFRMVIPLEYDKITEAGIFDDKRYKFFLHKGNKMGMTDSEANIILEPRFDEIGLISSFYKKSGILLTQNENKYQLFSFAGVPLDDEIYTSKTQEKDFLVLKPLILSNDKTKISIERGRINRNPK